MISPPPVVILSYLICNNVSEALIQTVKNKTYFSSCYRLYSQEACTLRSDWTFIQTQWERTVFLEQRAISNINFISSTAVTSNVEL